MATSTQQKQELFKAIGAIVENGYNLSVRSYIDTEDTRPQTDIKEISDHSPNRGA